MDPFLLLSYEVMLMIINQLDLTTLRALELMGVSRLWRDNMPDWTQRHQRVMHLSGGHLLHALPLVHTGRQLLDIIIDPPNHPFASLELEQVMLAVQQLRLPALLSLTLPSIRGSLPHTLNALVARDTEFPSNVTHWVQQLTLFLAQRTQVDLFHVMVHFPELTSLTLVWPLGQSQAQFVIPPSYLQPLALQSLTYLNIQGTVVLANYAQPLALKSLTYFYTQGTLPWDHLANFVQRCDRLAFLRIGWPHEGDMPQLFAMCPRLQYLWFDNRHEHVPPAIPMDAVTTPHPQQHAHHWTHLRQVIAFYPSGPTYRGITATLQAYQHVYLNIIQIRISPRWRQRDVVGVQLLVLEQLPSLSELVFDIHPTSTVVAPTLLGNHVLPLMAAAPYLQRLCIRLMHHDNWERRSLVVGRAHPFIPAAIFERIMNQMPNLQHLCLHAYHLVGQAVQILRQLRHHQVPLLSFDWLGETLDSIDLFGELASMPHLQ